jgi:hypothetical protein
MPVPKILPIVLRTLFVTGAVELVAAVLLVDHPVYERVLVGSGIFLMLISSAVLQEIAWRAANARAGSGERRGEVRPPSDARDAHTEEVRSEAAE